MQKELTQAEIERLTLVIAECAEVIQAATKVLLHGYEDYNPLRYDGRNNRMNLEMELGHLMLHVEQMQKYGDVDPANILKYMRGESEVVDKYLHHTVIV